MYFAYAYLNGERNALFEKEKKEIVNPCKRQVLPIWSKTEYERTPWKSY